MRIRRFVPLTLAAAMTTALAGCAGLNSTDQRMLSGGAIGAAAGAAGTALTGGCVSCGAAVGGAAGAAAGYLVDRDEKQDRRRHRRSRH